MVQHRISHLPSRVGLGRIGHQINKCFESEVGSGQAKPGVSTGVGPGVSRYSDGQGKVSLQEPNTPGCQRLQTKENQTKNQMELIKAPT